MTDGPGGAELLHRVALNVARCPQVPRARASAIHPCHKIVDLQSPDPEQWQVPEGWAGNLGQARVLFLSSNPNISEVGHYDDPLHAEDYPRGSWADDAIIRFAIRRFGESDDSPATIDGRSRRRDGQLSARKVAFWARVRSRAEELITDARPDRDYAMTEVVHCKSRREVGVSEAAPRCVSTHLDPIVALSPAQLIVVLGAKARNHMCGLWNLPDGFGTKAAVGAEEKNLAVRRVGGTERLIAYLWHPTGMTAPKTFSRAYPRSLPIIADLVNGRLDLIEAARLLPFECRC